MGVVVLGMHRSGTSVAAQVINRLGVPVGQGRLVPATDANPDGHWESWDLQEINNDLLAAFGGSWAGPPVMEDGWEASPPALQLDARAVSCWNRVHPGDHWMWKDPRNCLTLPFWIRVARLSGPAVIIYRDPQQVAASLAQRDGFSEKVGLALWERYNRDALRSVTGSPVLVSSYRSLTADPTGWAERTRRFLSSHGVACNRPEPVDQAASAVRADGRRGGRGDCAELSDSQRRLLGLLGEKEGEHDRLDLPDLGPPSPWMELLLTEHGRAYARELAVGAELARAHSQLAHVVNRTRLKVLAYRGLNRWAGGTGARIEARRLRPMDRNGGGP